MKKLVLLLTLIISASCSSPQTAPAVDPQVAAWQQRAEGITIVRDDWGVPHVYGKTDADAVFGVIYAQAEDDFNRVETNFMNSMGRLAEAEGEAEIWRDLRMKLFIDPDDLKAKYQTSPDWLKKLMDAWADGLNYYLHTHPQTKPRAIQKFEPWMALSFSEGSIGGDIERVSLTQLEAFYGGAAKQKVAELEIPAVTMPPEPTGSNGFAVGPSRTASGKAMLWINPHTSFFFREEAQMVSEEGLNAYGAITWGQFFIYQGFNERAGWMHTSSGADNIDEYLETVVKKDNGVFYRYGTEERAMTMKRIVVPYKTATGMAQREFTVYRTHHGPVVREVDGKWVSVRLMEEPVKALTQSVLAHQGEEPGRLPRDDGPAHELVEQHGVCRRRGQHRLLPRELRSQEGSEDSTGPSRWTAAPRPPSGRACTPWTRARTCSTRRTAGSRTPTTGRTRCRAPTARRKRTTRRTWIAMARTRVACTRCRCSRTPRD